MKILLDSHVVMWWMSGSDKLSDRAREAITSGDNQVLVSAVTLWELAIKESIGKLSLDFDLHEDLPEESFDELPITGDHAKAVRELPWHHKDPFDRMLIAQAKYERAFLITGDRKLGAYDVDLIPAR